jgi:hypothetical protein
LPAETHRFRHDQVDASAVLDLIWALASLPPERAEAEPDASLRELALDDELAKFEVWDAAVEEFAERTVGEPDLDELLAATTAGALAEAILGSLIVRPRDLTTEAAHGCGETEP